MKCPRCGHDNLQGSKFCDECAALLPASCPSCGTLNQTSAKFCRECSQPLNPTAAHTPTAIPTPISTAPTAVPTSFVNDRYQVKKFLGEGGKKKVYLALDTLLDREVAFALIKSQGLDDTARTRVRREAQAMGRLGSHPNIVTVFDLGDIDGQPYMVTEFMGGGDVEHLLKKAENHRLPIERCLEISHQIGMGLQFAHSRNIVHRDLKPGNVWLSTDGIAKIGDFGLALSLDRSRLTSEGMMIGTVSYMPPEQAMGNEVTHRADLYSLGAMLYEMVTGRPPFLGDDPVAIISQHINTPPVAPSWHNPRCPRDLEALVLRLLAKNPIQRPSNISDVLTALDCIDTKAVAERPEEEHSLDSLAGGVFVGRQKEMGELKAALEEALSGQGRLVMLVGEPGIGKTRTALELATYAGLRQAQVLWGRCYESQGTPPYWPWVQVIRSYVREHKPSELRVQMGAGAADIAEIVSDIRQRLPDLEKPPALDNPEAARFRLFDSIAAFLKSASSAQPLVLILDDLQWADKLTLMLLQFVASELTTVKVVIIGTYRDVELSRKHPLSQTLGELTRERTFRRVLLRGLSYEDVARFIELTSGLVPPDGLVNAVHTHTEGNPLFVNEVVRLLVQEGELSPQRLKERKSWSVRIPEGVREVIGRRLDRLSENCNQVLTTASIIGREFSLAQLTRLVEWITEDRLLEVMEEAISARVIEELPKTIGRYQFTHALVQETLVAELTSARRVRMHTRIAQALEALYGDRANEHAVELAYHYNEAEPVLGSERLVHYSLVAGEKALAIAAPQESLTHFRRGLAAKSGQPFDEQSTELVPDYAFVDMMEHFGRCLSAKTGLSVEANLTKLHDDPGYNAFLSFCYQYLDAMASVPIDEITAKLLLGAARAEAALYLFAEAAANLYQAFVHYASNGDLTHCIEAATVSTSHIMFVTMISAIVERAFHMVPADSAAAGWLLCSKGSLAAWYQGGFNAAKPIFKQATAIAQKLDDNKLQLRALSHLVQEAGNHLEVDEYMAADRQALELLQHVNSPHDEVVIRCEAAVISVQTGDMPEARHQARLAIQVAKRLRDKFTYCMAGWYAQDLEQNLGNWEAATDISDSMLTMDISVSAVLALRLLLDCQLGIYDEVDGYWQRMLKIVESEGGTAHHQHPYFMHILTADAARIMGNHLWLQTIQKAGQPYLDHVEQTGRKQNFHYFHSLAALGLVAAEEQDAHQGGILYKKLDQFIQAAVFNQYHRHYGIIAHAAGLFDKAVTHFGDALSFTRKAGFRPELAWTCCDYADLLRQRNEPGDSEKAVALLDEGLVIARDLSMRPLMERILSRRQFLKA